MEMGMGFQDRNFRWFLQFYRGLESEWWLISTAQKPIMCMSSAITCLLNCYSTLAKPLGTSFKIMLTGGGWSCPPTGIWKWRGITLAQTYIVEPAVKKWASGGMCKHLHSFPRHHSPTWPMAAQCRVTWVTWQKAPRVARKFDVWLLRSMPFRFKMSRLIARVSASSQGKMSTP